jgi:hypothetical protein
MTVVKKVRLLGMQHSASEVQITVPEKVDFVGMQHRILTACKG